MKSLIRLLIWGFLWIIAWGVAELMRRITKKPKLDNCLTWALRRWETDEESYLVIRWCRSARFRWMRWPHFMWLSQEHHYELRHFIPRVNDPAANIKIVPDFWFEGKIQKGDNKQIKEN